MTRRNEHTHHGSHRMPFDHGNTSDTIPSWGRPQQTNGDVLGWSPPVPKGKPVVRPNDERPLLRPFGNDLGTPAARDDVKYFASGVRFADREEVKHLLVARRYPRKEE